MIFSPVQILLTILAVTLGTMLTRFLPFLLFPNSSKTPKFIRYLGKVLPYAVMGMLVVYCLRNVSFTTAPFGAPEGACVGLRGGPAPLEEEYAFKHWSRYDPLYGAHPVRLYMNRAASDAVKTAPPVLCESTPAQCKSAALPARAIAVSAHLAERPAKRKSTTRKSL